MSDIYVGSLFSDSYLEHHGILGMKWGVRRFQNKDGSLTPAGKKRKISNENKREETRKAVRDYSKKYNKASKASDDADELWRDAKESYKNTGKTGITRVINNATKGKFADSQTKKAISEYSKKYNKASKASDDADELWRDAKESYKNTGKNALSRVANNIKYDPDREKKARLNSPDTKKRILKGAAIVGATALGAYAAYKIYDKRVPKYVDVGKTIINTKKISYSDDLVGKLPNGPSLTHPNKILKQTFTVNNTFNKTEKSNFTKSVPNPDRKFFSARGENTDKFNSHLNRLASSASFSDSRKNEAAKKINEKFARDVDDTVKAFRTGKINRKEYATRLKSLQATVDLSDRDEKKKKR